MEVFNYYILPLVIGANGHMHNQPALLSFKGALLSFTTCLEMFSVSLKLIKQLFSFDFLIRIFPDSAETPKQQQQWANARERESETDYKQKEKLTYLNSERSNNIDNKIRIWGFLSMYFSF